MKRIALCMLALLMLVGCGNDSQTSETVEKDLPGIYAQMEAQLPEMLKLSDVMMLDLLGIKADFYNEAHAYICADGLQVNEVWLVKAADTESLDTLKLLAQTRLDSQKAIYQSYAPDQYAILEEGRILTHGLYMAFIVSENAGALAEIFEK